MALVRLTVVPSELEAEMLCGELRANAIACEHQAMDFLSGAYGSAVSTTLFGQAAQTEVLVDESQLETARSFLPDVST
jgi:hypothetical protein